MLNLTQLLSFAYPSSHTSNISALGYSQEFPAVVVWNLTKSCNLNCIFCYYDAKRNLKPNNINYNLINRIAKQIKQAKIKYLILSGGEPLLYPKILSLLKNLTATSMRVGISSNGTLLNKKLALDLKKSGLDYIGISLDGLKATHNRLRNSIASFNQALGGLKYAKDAGIKTGLRMTLNSYNYNEIKDIFSLAENLKVNRLCFYHLVYSGRASKENNDLSMHERQKALKLIIKYTVEWLKRKIPIQVLTVDNFSDAVAALNFVKAKNPQNYTYVLESLKKQAGCPAGKRILSIDHRGIVHPCQFWQSYKLGDLRKESLSDILGDGLFKEWKTKLRGRCAICNYKDICGGCRVRAYQAYRDYWQEDPSCEINILERN